MKRTDMKDDIKFKVCTFSEIWKKLDGKIAANKSDNEYDINE